VIADAAELAATVGGVLHGPDVRVDGATIDSRLVRGGELFVPVAAARDGHSFIAAALDAGAVAYLTAREPERGTAIAVRDTGAALAALGRWARARLPDRVVAVTGSTGKTSTKDLVAGILERGGVTAASERSFNNELGVPLMLFNAPERAHAAVVEMGARGPGHIASLCEIARPHVGVVTNVGPAHIELFGDLDTVARSKGELPAALPADGTAVLNADDHRVAAMQVVTEADVLTFGTGGDVRATDVTVDGELRAGFLLVSPWGDARVELGARGVHQVPNALAAAAAALALGSALDDVVQGLAHARLSPWRMDVSRTASGAVVVNDAYNANPQSTEAALRSLAALEATRRVAVLGPMLELGAVSEREHRRIGELARTLGIAVVTVGAPAYGGEDVDDIDAALTLLGVIGPGDAVLVKASRAAGLERLAAALHGGLAVEGEEPEWSRS
jgi:UDP-N-acetylmuramoyl-tripeptide--D-alanyl-D-alanine ligase